MRCALAICSFCEVRSILIKSPARVAELADALASGASVRKNVGVQVPPRAPKSPDLYSAECGSGFFYTTRDRSLLQLSSRTSIASCLYLSTEKFEVVPPVLMNTRRWGFFDGGSNSPRGLLEFGFFADLSI